MIAFASSRVRSSAFLGAIVALALLLAVGVASPARADFGVSAFDGRVTGGPSPLPVPNPGDPTDPANFAPDFTQAGGHPYEAATTFSLRTEVAPTGEGSVRAEGGRLRDVAVKLPAGLIGNPAAAPQCLNVRRIAGVADFASNQLFDPARFCPTDSIVGTAFTRVGYSGLVETKPSPLYSVEPSAGVAAAFAFEVEGGTTVIEAHLRDDGEYRIEATVRNVNDALNVIGSEVVLWGNPAHPSHDPYRCGVMLPVGVEFIPPLCTWAAGEPGGPGPAGYPEAAFLSNPTACTPVGAGVDAEINLSAYNDAAASASFESHRSPGYSLLNPVPVSEWGPVQGPDGCEAVPFEPEAEFVPTNQLADAPTGLTVDLSVPSDGLEDPNKISQSHLKKAVVTLPQGMTVNPSSAAGLDSCSPAQLSRETASSKPGEGCPLAAKIGAVEVQTPLLSVRDANGVSQRDVLGQVLPEPLTGSVYLAKQNDNPFNSLLALYVVVKNPQRGIAIKLPGKVEADPATGRLTATFDNNPQLPFSNLHLEFKTGSRAPLIAPRQCGTYAIESDLYPWARPTVPVHSVSKFKITEGPDGKPCPSGSQFDPSFEAGTLTPIAGAYSPLIVNASRPDGSEPLTGLKLDLPQGLLGKLAGIPYCSNAALAAAAGKTGQSEISSASCPAASKVGSIDVAAGAGGTPFHVGGQAYLAGPYKGAPLSIAVITPAVAGPFDLGTVVVRAKADVDPATAQIHVTSDPIPTILQGIPLKIRSVSVNTDRPQFTLNPTDCSPMSFSGALLSSSISRSVSNPFQVGACKALDFEPKLAIKLSGKTHRSAHPALKATLTMPQGSANIQRAAVTLPRTEFLEQSHIRTICTRVQYAAKNCPKASIYGYAKAWSPLLDKSLEGPVYLRSSNNPLPDLVASLDGQIHIDLSGRIDSPNARIRNTFDLVPDAPVSKFVLTMQGGKKGLLVNNTELCKAKPRAEVKFDGQNGKVADSQPMVKADCRKGRKGKRK